MYMIQAVGTSTEVVPLMFNEATSTLQIDLDRNSPSSDKRTMGSSPSWITFRNDKSAEHGKLSYIIDEAKPGRVFVAATVKEETQKDIQRIGEAEGYATKGDGSVSACVQNGCLFVANYLSGSASVLPLDSLTGLPVTDKPAKVFTFSRKGTGPVGARQDSCYAHDAVASPDGAWVYICDLGADRIHRIKTAPSAEAYQKCSYDASASTVVPDGSGPRHLAFYKNAQEGRQFAYLTNELNGTVTAFEHDITSGQLTMIDSPVRALPQHVSLGGSLHEGPQHTLAEVACSQDGLFVYASDRDTAPSSSEQQDHISIFARDAQTGSLTFLKWVETGGQIPRHFSLSHDDKYIVVANSQSDAVVVLARDAKTGDLMNTSAKANVKGVFFAGFC